MNRTLKALTLLATCLVWSCGSNANDDAGAGGTGAKSGTGSTQGKGGGSGSGSGGSSAGGSSAGGGSAGGATSFAGQTRADSGSTDAVSGSAHVATSPNGTIYVTWVSEGSGLVVARSRDGGQSFEPPVQVENTVKPLVSMARHPYIAATDTRVAVAFNEQGGTVYVYDSQAADTLAFGSGKVIGSEIATDFRDFPKPAFIGGQDLSVVWHGYPQTGARLYLSRESAGLKSEEVSGGAPGVPCECCPLDILQMSGGSVVVAFRNNDNNIREMWSAQAIGSGAFSKWSALSGSEGMIMSCPMQGPRLAEIDSTLISVWSSRGSTTQGIIYQASSTDGGASWSTSESVGGFQADEPTIAVGASGRIFVTGVTGSASSALVSSDDGGKTWSSPEPLEASDGALKVPQAAGTSGVAVLAAISTAGSVWLKRME